MHRLAVIYAMRTNPGTWGSLPFALEGQVEGKSDTDAGLTE